MGEFTRYQLRKRAEALQIDVRYGQFAKYVNKGLLPDPELELWAEEEIVPRFLRIHELEARAWSLDRRVVILFLERYPVPPAKLRDAMVGMLPTITKPARKLARVAAAGAVARRCRTGAGPDLRPRPVARRGDRLRG